MGAFVSEPFFIFETSFVFEASFVFKVSSIFETFRPLVVGSFLDSFIGSSMSSSIISFWGSGVRLCA